MQKIEEPSVGIVIRTKDRPIFVTRALATVQAQVYRNWKIMLVNDGGDAATLADAIMAQASALRTENRLTVLNLDPGMGRSAAFNQGVAALRTDFVACLDDDDTWDPEFLSELVAFYTRLKPDVDDLGGVAAKVTALKEDFFETPAGMEIRVIGEDELPRAFFRGEFFLNPLAYACYRQDIYPVQWIMRREAVQAVGGFPEAFDVMEDRAFMNRFLGRNRLAILDRKLAYHHRRVKRSSDNSRNVLMNTLDNPSYDWRMFADLARPGVYLGASDRLADTVRSFAADLLSEVNYETSAIWQKVDGEMRALQTRLDRERLELQTMLTEIMADLARQRAAEPSAAPALAARPAATLGDVANRVYDLWAVVGQKSTAQHLVHGQRFAGKLVLSRQNGEDGQLLHIDPQDRLLELQLPTTGGWSAVEVELEDFVREGRGLRLHVVLDRSQGFLFETALICKDSFSPTESYRLSDLTVHSCAQDQGCVLSREIPAAWLASVGVPKLSIILPRHATNFCFRCRDLVIELV